MPTITRLEALEILDSRGRPTIQVTCHLDGGAVASAQVPSGASTGSAEALELRDRDPSRHRGLGCRLAVANVTGEIQAALAGMDLETQADLDAALIQLDGTPSKKRLGANAILGVSLAFCRATAHARGIPLFRHLAEVAGITDVRLPRPTVNLFSGGKHAGGQVAIQDVLVVPVAARTMDEALAHVAEVFHAAAALCSRKFGARNLVADEGGLAPAFPNAESMLGSAVEAIQDAGFRPGEDIAMAVDVASTHFFENGRYHLDGSSLDSAGMISLLDRWVTDYPVVSVEDGLSEDDWENWPELLRRLQGRALVLGDDLLCTNPVRIGRAVTNSAANALLLKVNQVGTLSESLAALRAARSAGWHLTISARSGETEDDWLADLATGWAGDHIKIGSITRSERLAKYNRLLAIEQTEALVLVGGASGKGPRWAGGRTACNLS